MKALFFLILLVSARPAPVFERLSGPLCRWFCFGKVAKPVTGAAVEPLPSSRVAATTAGGSARSLGSLQETTSTVTTRSELIKEHQLLMKRTKALGQASIDANNEYLLSLAASKGRRPEELLKLKRASVTALKDAKDARNALEALTQDLKSQSAKF